MKSVLPHSIIKSKKGDLFVFSVRLASTAVVYMSVNQNKYSSNDYQIVTVDACKFLAAWRAEPTNFYGEFSNANKEFWRNSRKFHLADEGFSRGKNDPVPLADVTCETLGERHHVFFTNGITRTIWLLANECRFFPVLCQTPGAINLQKYVSSDGYRMLSVDTIHRNFI